MAILPPHVRRASKEALPPARTTALRALKRMYSPALFLAITAVTFVCGTSLSQKVPLPKPLAVALYVPGVQMPFSSARLTPSSRVDAAPPVCQPPFPSGNCGARPFAHTLFLLLRLSVLAIRWPDYGVSGGKTPEQFSQTGHFAIFL